ncbi:hypothetical protein KBB68_03860 [Candidatus Babeliales bacterium]|nr:hypothetical protein [Candidatus Babeliales bacterium]
MRYQIIFFFCFSFQYVVADDKNFDECAQKIEELKILKIKLQKETMQHHEELFSNLQMYGRTAGQIATAAILFAGQVQSKNKNQLNASRLSTTDSTNIVQAIVTGFILMVEIARFCHARTMHKKFVNSMTYEDFVTNFSHLVLVEYHILLMKTLISLSQNGNFGQQVFARLMLVKMSLPYPFAKFANKAAKKMYKISFDKFGNFIFVEIFDQKHPYKKFFQKVAQNWKEIALRAQSFSEIIEPEYCSTVSNFINTPYNNALIEIIHAGMKGDFEKILQIRQLFVQNELMKKLEQFYVDQCHDKVVTNS